MPVSMRCITEDILADPSVCKSEEDAARVRTLGDEYHATILEAERVAFNARRAWVDGMIELCGGRKNVALRAVSSSVAKRRSPTRPSNVDAVVEEFLCPILNTLPLDPVTAEDGHLYDRTAIQEWLQRKKTSPMTNLPMGERLFPAPYAKRTIQILIDSLDPSDDRIGDWKELRVDASVTAMACFYATKLHMTPDQLRTINTKLPALPPSTGIDYVERLHKTAETMFVQHVPCHSCSYCRRSKRKRHCRFATTFRPEWIQHGDVWLKKRKSGP